MSYLLDALKQSQQNSTGEAFTSGDAALHYQQQAELARYKRLVYIFGGALAMVLTLGGGFIAGKWVQQHAPLSEPATQQAAITSAQNDDKPAPKPALQEQLAPQNSGQLQSMNGQPVMSVQQNGMPAVQWVPVQPVYQMMVPQQGYQAQPVQAKPDLSQYKVVGKPLTQPQEPERIEQKADDPALKGVSSELKSAFAEAVAATENQEAYEVTQGTTTSSEAQPIELLPDVLRNQIPAFRYQAHIYATDPERRWIKLNGQELYEGQGYGELYLEEIAPDQIVLNLRGNRFSVRAMQDWGMD